MKFNFLKKVMAVAVAGVVVVGSMSGCGSKSGIDKIKKAGVLNVGVKVDVPNFGYKNAATNEVEGFEIDLAKAISKEILGDENKIAVQGVTAKTRGPLLDTGELDLVIATFTITEERKKTYNFSQSYYTDAIKLMVKKDSGITGMKDLDGKTIGVAQSATSKDALAKAGAEIGVTPKFAEFATYPEIKAALDSGRVDCFSVDGSILSGYVDDKTVILDERYTEQEYGVASKKDNTELATKVDEIITNLKSSGELDKMLDKWGLK